jgi:hypothetical protein
MMHFDTRTPHGHTLGNSKPETRLKMEVVVRPGHNGQMLPDGRVYAAGKHTLQIYSSHLQALENMVEPDESLVTQAENRHKQQLARFLAEKKGNVAESYTGSPQASFHELNFRDIKPLLSAKVIEELDSIEDEAKRKHAQMVVETSGAAVQAAQGAGTSLELAKILAGITVALDKMNARIDNLSKK